MKQLTELQNRAITFSVLSHIRNRGELYESTMHVFTPLIKRALAKMCSDGVSKGDSVFTIKEYTDKLYSIDFPLTIIKLAINEISREINVENKVYIILHNDGSFDLDHYKFADIDDEFSEQQRKIHDLENNFKQFCKIQNYTELQSESIFSFIESNKLSLGRYFGSKNSRTASDVDFSVQASFVKYFKVIPDVYEAIKTIYLGSLIATYLEYDIKNTDVKIELVLDTNFIVSLLDLNTIESTYTCSKLLEIAHGNGFQLVILDKTIEEIESLLRHKAESLHSNILGRKANPEDILNACDRRGLTKTDLENIYLSVEKKLKEFNIRKIVVLPHLIQSAKQSKEYGILKDVRNSEKSALHDAIAIQYVLQRRNHEKIFEFEKSRCWFVNNAFSQNNFNVFTRNELPVIIKADDLLNILWLSNPLVQNSIKIDEFSEIGLSSSISFCISKNTPKSSVIKELDDGICKYVREDVTDDDVFRLSTRIAQRKVREDDELFKLNAETERSAFAERIKLLAEMQRQDELDASRKLAALLDALSKGRDNLKEKESQVDLKIEQVLKSTEIQLNESNKTKEDLSIKLSETSDRHNALKRKLINEKVSKWKFNSIYVTILFWTLLSVVFIIDLKVYSFDIETVCNEFNKIKLNSFKWFVYGSAAAICFIPSKVMFSRLWSANEEAKYREMVEKEIA